MFAHPRKKRAHKEISKNPLCHIKGKCGPARSDGCQTDEEIEKEKIRKRELKAAQKIEKAAERARKKLLKVKPKRKRPD